jgi:hypothetical protein
MKKIKLLFLTLFIANFGYAQTSLMDSLIQKNITHLKKAIIILSRAKDG